MGLITREEIEEEDDFEKEKKWVEVLRAIFMIRKRKKMSYPESYVA